MTRHRSVLPTLLQSLTTVAVLTLTTVGWHGMPPAAAADTPVTIMGAGDIAGAASASKTLNATSTGDLIRAAAPEAVFTLGDNTGPDATLTDYQLGYEPTWGSFRAATHPVPGNHEYRFIPPAGYLDYFGSTAVTNDVDGGLYYAWDVGNGWRAYAVNTQIPRTGAQLAWLQGDVAAHPGMHYILYAHQPRYTSGTNHAPSLAICPLWNALAATGGLEIVMGAHNHQYERFAKMDCAGNASATGARSFVAGTGGDKLYAFGTPQPGSEFRNNTDNGVLKLVLHDTSYEWSFIASGRGWNGTAYVNTGNAGAVLDSGSQPTNGAPGPGNVAPTVNAGPDQMVTLPAPATLDATVTDDGLPSPPAAVTTAWSQLSGPGTVTFAAPTAVDTTATFSQPGSYVLQLSADDSQLTATDTVTVTVVPGGGTAGTVQVRVAAGSDDAEQRSSGSVALKSSDLELTTDGANQQVVGIRFLGVQIPAGATVTGAYVQFQVDEVSTGPSSMTIRAEASDNAATYTSARGSVTGRAVVGGVPWSPPAWPTVRAAGPDQRTPDIAALVQAVVNRPGWTPGNALALQFSGTGRRTAEAFEGSAAAAPLLHVDYTVP